MLQRITFDTSKTASISLPGNYVAFITGTTTGTSGAIKLKPENGGSEVALFPGMDVAYPETSTNWTIAAEQAGAVVTGELYIGAGRINDRRITGTVDVNDAGRSRSIAGSAFQASWGYPETTGWLNHVGIEFPAAQTTRRMVLKRARIRVDSTVPPATGIAVIVGFEATGTTLAGGAPGVQAGGRKLPGGAAPFGQIVYNSGATAQPNPTSVIGNHLFRAGDSMELVTAEPIILPAGQRLRVSTQSAQCAIGLHCEWTEELI